MAGSERKKLSLWIQLYILKYDLLSGLQPGNYNLQIFQVGEMKLLLLVPKFGIATNIFYILSAFLTFFSRKYSEILVFISSLVFGFADAWDKAV